ncbi:MAG: hypothetical protein M1834_007639 [Cirrosporium novae-zelandiae]|nr:MAG: hypothetical protein M1834_007639 [Cirrosporium novae-zelandiae]
MPDRIVSSPSGVGIDYKPLAEWDHAEILDGKERKQLERATRISNLPAVYNEPISAFDKEVVDEPIEELVQDVHKGIKRPIDILRTYGKVAIRAHEKSNCLTEIMLPEAEKWAEKEINTKGPLAGIPVSLKDTIIVKGFDSSVGLSRKTGKPYAADGPMVKLLKDAGAVPYVKTAVPITLLSFESTNDVWGVCSNPHNKNYSPGGSTGGEGALLALGGRIGIGSDVAGSVRAPAHFSGIYSLRCSVGRWPKMGGDTSMPGQEGIPSVFSPMARTLNDLQYFTESMIGMRPWQYDHTVHPIPWKADQFQEAEKQPSLRIGVLESDGVVAPAPACSRALSLTVSSLRKAGHTVIPITPPSPLTALDIGAHLLLSDGGKTYHSFHRTFETNDAGAHQINFWTALPRPLQYLYVLYVRHIKRDPVWASLLDGLRSLSAREYWKYVSKREAYKISWHEWWNQPEQSFDFLITPANATPAVPHKGMKDAVSSCGYTFLFNLLDYTCGIVPVTKVDAELDKLPEKFSIRALNGVARGAYKLYDAQKMAGLPVAVQIVGRRLEEEKVLGFMGRVEEALTEEGLQYQVLDID